MSGGKSNKKNIVSIIIVVALLIGACFATITIYAKKTLNKPKFSLPEEEPVASARELPKTADGLCAYVNSLYENVLASDEAEGSWHTDVGLDGEINVPFADADREVLTFIKDNAAPEVAGLYPNESNVKMAEAENAPVIRVNPADVLEFTAEQGHTDEEGNVRDDGFYFITFVLTPTAIDTAAMTSDDVYAGAVEKLADAAEIKETEFTAERYEISYKIDRITDQIVNIDVSKDYQLKTSFTFKEAYSALMQDAGEAQLEMPYKTALRIGFKWYGARFTQRSMAVRPGDMKALPASVVVNTEATKEDYKLTFEPSDKEALTIDEDGVMTVEKAADEPVTVKMTLEYNGHTYTDELLIYITELEVETNV